MMIEYTVRGITLSECEVAEIHKYYEIACTAGCIVDNFGLSEDEAMKRATEVREYMDKHECSESDAISELLGETDDEEDEE